MTKDQTIDMLYARIGLLRATLETCETSLDIIARNAEMIPDPKMDGLTDCYRVPLEDVDNIREMPKLIRRAIIAARAAK